MPLINCLAPEQLFERPMIGHRQLTVPKPAGSAKQGYAMALNTGSNPFRVCVQLIGFQYIYLFLG